MNRSLIAKFAVTAAVAAAAFGAASAQARSDVYLSIGVQGAPFYAEPAPVYVQPRPVYVRPPVYSAPAEVYVREATPVYAYGYDEERAWRRAEMRRRYWRHHHQDMQRFERHDRHWD